MIWRALGSFFVEGEPVDGLDVPCIMRLSGQVIHIRAYNLTPRIASGISCICSQDDEGSRLTALERILLKKDAIVAKTFLKL